MFLDNHSSTITFTSPITSSRYGDDGDSKYAESSMDSGRHIDLRKCKIKKVYTPTYVSTHYFFIFINIFVIFIFDVQK